jgi:hypothetical protein
MRLLIDECVPEDVVAVFANRNHEIFRVVDELAPGTPDALVAQFASSQALICVTWNRRHFHALISRRPRNNQNRFPAAGLIAFACPEPHADRRLLQVIEIIEHEYERAQQRRDKRLIVDVMADHVQIWW